MPWNGSGVFNRTTGIFTGTVVWADSKGAGRTVNTDDHDTHDEDIATGLENTVTRDGQNEPTANLPMGGFRHTGVDDAVSRTDYSSAAQIQDGGLTHVAPASVGGTGDAITLTPSPSITAYVAGQRFSFVAEATNTGAVTVNVSSVGAQAIQKLGSALVAGDITLGDLVAIRYDGTQFQMMTPARTGVYTNGSVPLAALADGTDGQIITWDSSGVITAIGPGTAGQLLTSNGAGAEPSFQTLDTSLPRSYLAGLQLANNGTDADHDIDIAVGECRGSDDDEDIALASVFVKQIDASWAAGTNQGGLSSSLTLSADTWYHVHAINVGGSSDVGFDTSVTAANLITDHSATAYRRIGAVLTDSSSNIIAFTQVGDTFYWTNGQNDVDTSTTSTAAILYTLSTPLGVKTIPLARFSCDNSSATTAIIVSSPQQADEAPDPANAPGSNMVVFGGAAEGADIPRVHTDTSSQIRFRQDGGGGGGTVFVVITTTGWIDDRGRSD